METRRATLVDLDTIVPLFEAYRLFYEEAPDAERSRRFLGARLAGNDAVIFVALEGTACIGFTQLYPLFSSTRCQRMWLLNDLFVTGQARGRGVAAALMARAEQFAAEDGACGLELATAHTNLAAQRLYESRGWKLDEVFRRYELGVGGR
ncbi:MAG: GNAT family N-acetyltransferase [Gemmatimonadales bacterium]